MTDTLPALAILGGTGSEGSGLAFRWAHAGYRVFLGSRSAEKAVAGAAAFLLCGIRTSPRMALREVRIAPVIVPFASHLRRP